MVQVLRWGILGAAKFAREHMGPAIHAARHNQLVALATSDAQKAAPFQAFEPGLRLHDSYEALLADPGIDAVYVPLPNHLHVEWTLKALAAGKHVLTEKPVAMREDEFDALIAARDKAGLLAAEAYMIVHHPQWERARDLYRAGAIGRLVHVSAAFSYDNRHDPDNIRNRPETGGGGLRDIGVYIFGAARFVTGQEPESLSAMGRFENDVDVFAHVTAEFPDFSYAGYVSTRMALRQEMVFHGEKGVLKIIAPFNAGVFDQATVIVEGPGLETRAERFPGVNHYVLQVENFARTVREGAEYPCPLEFSRGTQRMIDMSFAALGR